MRPFPLQNIFEILLVAAYEIRDLFDVLDFQDNRRPQQSPRTEHVRQESIQAQVCIFGRRSGRERL